MRIITSVEELKALRLSSKYRLGFVPTMGALHEGHLSLIRCAQRENEKVLCSIFVNPTQFNNPSDLENYPRKLEEDLVMLEGAGCDFVFTPTASDMYPKGLHSVDYHFGELEKVMEGSFRPGHFKGVATIVHRFFDLIQPHKAYFGEKDFQQLQIIKKLVVDKHLAVEVVACPTQREPSGLAMSSRNERLTKEQRMQAQSLYLAMSDVQSSNFIKKPQELQEELFMHFRGMNNVRPEYIEFVDAESLKSIENWEDAEHVRMCMAVFFGEVRLIDNLLLF